MRIINTMPVFPFFYLIGQTAQDPATSVEAYLAARPNLTVAMTFSSNIPGFTGSALIRIKRPNLLNADFKVTNYHYSLIFGKDLCIEALPDKGEYGEFINPGSLTRFTSRFDLGIGNLNFAPLVNGKIFRAKSYKISQRLADSDIITAKITSKGGQITETEIEVARTGEIRRIRETRTNGPDVRYLETKFGPYSTPILDQSLFLASPLPGWNAVGLTVNAEVLPAGSDIPTGDIRSPDGSNIPFANVAKGKVIAVLDPAWVATDFGKGVLETLAQKFKSKDIVKVADEAAYSGKGYYVDTTGNILRELAPQGSPTFYVFDSAGHLAQAFFGVSPREPEAFYRDVDEYLKDKKSE